MHIVEFARKQGYLSEERERELLARAQAGDQRARDQLVLSHLRVVTAQAKKHACTTAPFDDLVAVGIVGLLKAIDRFRPERANGGRLCTYCTWWIRAEILQHIMDTASLCKMGTTAAGKRLFFGLRRVKNRMGITGTPTPEQAERIADELQVTPEQVLEMDARLHSDLSLNSPVRMRGKEGQEVGELIDHLVDPSDPLDEQTAERQERELAHQRLEEALAILPEREAYIIRRRKLAETPATLEELKEELGISRERVRQLEQKGLQRMEHYLRTGKKLSGQAHVRERRLEFIASTTRQ